MNLKIKEVNLEKDTLMEEYSGEKGLLSSTPIKLNGELTLEVVSEEVSTTSKIHICNISDELMTELHDVLNKIENEFIHKKEFSAKEVKYKMLTEF